MRKSNWNTTKLLAAMFAGALMLSACGDDDDPNPGEPSTPSQPTTPETPSQDKALSTAEQQQRMESIANEVMQLMPASDFSDYSKLGKYINDTYKNYDWSNVSEWAKNAWNATREATGNQSVGNRGSFDKYVYTEYKNLLLAANYTGHFKANNGKWLRTDAKDLQFEFTDQNGANCVLKLETSGNVVKVHAADIEEWTDYDYDEVGGSYLYTEYYDRTACTIGVPENIVVTLTQGGKQLVKTTVKVNLANLQDEEFDISKSSATVSAVVELSNGYTFNSSQIAYTGNSKVTVAQAKVSKSGKDIVTIAMSSDLSGIPSCNVSAFTREDFDFDKYKTDNATGKNAFVKIDVLGKLQLQGTVADVRKYSDYLDKAEDNYKDENTYKQYIEKANGLADINVFYDNSAVKQASIVIDTFEDEDWDGTRCWTMEPVMKFYDGSQNSQFGLFFNDVDFKSTINLYKSLVDDYEALFK